jgi:hypothetical protein
LSSLAGGLGFRGIARFAGFPAPTAVRLPSSVWVWVWLRHRWPEQIGLCTHAGAVRPWGAGARALRTSLSVPAPRARARQGRCISRLAHKRYASAISQTHTMARMLADDEARDICPGWGSMRKLGRLIINVGIVLSIIVAALVFWALFGIVGAYIFLGILDFAAAFSVHFGISQAYVYVIPFGLLFFTIFGVGNISIRHGRVAYNIVSFIYALFWAITVEVFWAIGMGGLLTGLQVSRKHAAHWFYTIIVHIPTLANPTQAATIGAIVGLPLAALAFWKDLNPFWRLNAHIRLSRRHHVATKRISSKPSIAPGARETSKIVVQLKLILAVTVRHVTSFLGNGSIWAGVVVSLGTLCGIAASWSGSLTISHVILALIASAVAGIFAALQWRLTSRRS